jgi:Holliday junction DNA helicase, RuvA subunit
MFYYIKGTVAHIEQSLVVIDAGGVGYALNTSYTSASTAKVGDSATFYTFLHTREDIFDLYGFATQSELSCFKQLISVSGVGPKAALAILGALSPEKLALSVVSGDEKALTAAPGVGKKLAQRIILELKDKLGATPLEASDFAGGDTAALPTGGAMDNALAALAVLGYPRSAAAQALKGAEATLGTDELVRYALKRLF